MSFVVIFITINNEIDHTTFNLVFRHFLNLLEKCKMYKSPKSSLGPRIILKRYTITSLHATDEELVKRKAAPA